MADLEWFPFYWRDFDEATREMTNEEVGAYCRLLYYQWQYGSIPNDKLKAGRISGEAFTESVWRTLSSKFKPTDQDRLLNERMEKERLRAESIYRRKVEGGRRGGLKASANRAGKLVKNQERGSIPTRDATRDATRTPTSTPTRTPGSTPSTQRDSNKKDNLREEVTSRVKGSGSRDVCSARAKRARRAPENLKISDATLAWARKEFPKIEPVALGHWMRRELAKLKDHEFANPRSDWEATLRNWLRRSHETGHSPAIHGGTAEDERQRRRVLELAAMFGMKHEPDEEWEAFEARVTSANDRRLADLNRGRTGT